MPKLKDLFRLNIEDEISLVVKTDDVEPAKIEKEINEYIVTDQIEEHLETFLENYTLQSTENIGVWISGFFGSGKSYFAKILSYIISNPHFSSGLTAHDRFKERLNSSTKKDFINGLISKTEDIPSQVIMFEIISDSSSDTNSVEAIMLKKLFQKLGYSKYPTVSSMEFELHEQGLYYDFKRYVVENKANFNTVQSNAGTFRKYAHNFLVEEKGYSPKEADDFLTSALKKYYQSLTPEEFTDVCLRISEEKQKRIAFIVDEMGAFVTSQGDKSDEYLLQLQSISENFASKGKGKLWLIVTSQEKLNEVSQVAKRRNVFSKIVDRFAIKLDLTSENVDEVIRKKMLLKKSDAQELLEKLFKDKIGNIQMISDTKGIYPKTEDSKKFINYYPFFDYHFKLLNDLIESPFGTRYATASERKLISIVDDVLKRIKDEEHTTIVNIVNIFDGIGVGFFGSGVIEHFKRIDEKLEESCKENPVKPSDIMKALTVIKMINSQKEMIHSDEEVLTRMLITNLDEDFHEIKKHVHECVERLKYIKAITSFDGTLSIVSDAERDFMNYMNDLTISLPEKKERIRESLKNVLNFTFTYQKGPNIPIEFTYNDDNKKWGKSGGISVKILRFETNEEKVKEIQKKAESESMAHPETIYMVPAPSEIESKAEEIKKIEKTLEEFQNKKSQKLENIIEKYGNMLQKKTKDLEKEIKNSLSEGTLFYMIESNDAIENLESSIKKIIEDRVIENLYGQITSEKAKIEDVKKILTEPQRKLPLVRQDEDHAVFDENGELIEGHKIVKPLMDFLKEPKRGSDILDEFGKAPYGWTQETIFFATAALFRSGKIEVNKNDDYTDPEMISILTTASKFKNAIFSLNTTVMLPEQKEELSKLFEEILDKKEVRVEDSKRKFFQVGQKAMEKVVSYAEKMEKMLSTFGNAPNLLDMRWFNEAAFKLRSEDFKTLEEIFEKRKEISENFSNLRKNLDFLEENVERLKNEKNFIEQIAVELKNASVKNEKIESLMEEYKKMSSDILGNAEELGKTFEKIRNEYKVIFQPFHEEKEKLFDEMRELLNGASEKQNRIGERIEEQEWFKKYKERSLRSCPKLEIKYSPKCENCKHALYETQLLIGQVKSEMEEFKRDLDEFMKKTPKIEFKEDMYQQTKKIKFKKRMTYGELKKKISENAFDDDAIVEIELEG